jgi:hypothetical protein
MLTQLDAAIIKPIGRIKELAGELVNLLSAEISANLRNCRLIGGRRSALWGG